MSEGNVLPLDSACRVALFGNASYDLVAGGTGNDDANKAYLRIEQDATLNVSPKVKINELTPKRSSRQL